MWNLSEMTEMTEIINIVIFDIVIAVVAGTIVWVIKSRFSKQGKQEEKPSNKNAIREMIRNELQLYSEFLEKIQFDVDPKQNSILQFGKSPEQERLLSPGKPTMTITHFDSLTINDKAEFFSSPELKDIENAYEAVRNYHFRWAGLWNTLKDDSLKLKLKIDKAIEHF